MVAACVLLPTLCGEAARRGRGREGMWRGWMVQRGRNGDEGEGARKVGAY